MTTAQSEGYSHGKHIAGVQAAARAAGVKGSAFAVLAYMCSAADYRKPVVRVCKETICERTGYCWDTVRIALRQLRDRGFLRPIAYKTGGRERATVYALTSGKNGVENPPPLQTEEIEKGGGFSGQKGVENPVKRGWKSRPPSMVSSDISSRVEGVASRDGRTNPPLDAGASASRGGDDPARAELAQFAREVTLHGYAEARARQKARQAASGAGL